MEQIKENIVKDTVDLWDLVDKKVYVKIKKECINDFLTYAVKSSGGKQKLIALLQDKRIRNLYVYKNQNYFIDLRLINKILEIFSESEKKKFMLEISKNLQEIRYGYGNGKSIVSPQFPIKFSPTVAEVCGHILGDGGIGYTKDYHVYFTNQCFSLADRFKQTISDVLGRVDAYDHYKESDKTRNIGFPNIVGIILIEFFGPMVGDLKHVPEIVLNSNKESKSAFLRALFDDEGCVGKNRIIIQMSNKKVMEDIKCLLTGFGIQINRIEEKIHKNARHKTSYRIDIYGYEDIKHFSDSINFYHPDKKEKLQELLKGYENKIPKYKNGEPIKLILKALENKQMSIYELSQCLNRKPSRRFRSYLAKLESSETIKSIKNKNLKIYSLNCKIGNYEVSKRNKDLLSTL